MPGRVLSTLFIVAVVLLAGCDDGRIPPREDGATTQTSGFQRVPDVIDVEVAAAGDTYRFDVTVSSPYDSPERYADAFRVLTPDGDVLAVRELLHDHADEQPFTRSLGDVAVPAGIRTVTVQARDLEYGWGGGTVEVELPDR